MGRRRSLRVQAKKRTLRPHSLHGQTRPSQAPPSQAPPSQAPPSQAPPSQAPPSQAPPSQAPHGRTRHSQTQLGQAPHSQTLSPSAGNIDRGDVAIVVPQEISESRPTQNSQPSPAPAPGPELDHTFFDEGSAEARHESEALDFEIPGLAKSRRALWVGLTMFAVSAIGSGGYLAHHGRRSPPAAAIGQMGPLPLGDYRVESELEPLRRVEPQSTAPEAPRPEAEVDEPTPEVEVEERAVEVEVEVEERAAEVEVGVEERAAEVEVSERGLEVEVDEPALEVVTPEPSSSAELSKEALAKLGKGRYKVAQELALHATAVDPSNAEGWIVLGAARQGLRDHPGARNAYKTCAGLKSSEYSRECRRMLR